MLRRPLLSLLTVVVVLVSVLSVSFVAQAKSSAGNNSLDAKDCKGTGYLSLYREDGTGFNKAVACRRYAAAGGVLLTAPPTRNVSVFITAISSCNSLGEGGRSFSVVSSGFVPNEQLRYVFTGVVSYEVVKNADASGSVPMFVIDGITNGASGALTVTVFTVPGGQELGSRSVTVSPYICTPG
jgi:hypothetical protein